MPSDDRGVSGHPSAVGDPGAALVELYDVALPHVYGYLLARSGRTALAEDLTADTFLAPWMLFTGRTWSR